MVGIALAARVAKSAGALYIERYPNWGGRECFCLYFNNPEEEPTQVGYPQILMTDGEDYDMAGPMEVLAYLRFIEKRYGIGNDGSLTGFKSEGPIKL